MCSYYVLYVFFKYKTHINGSNKTLDFLVRIKIDNKSKANLYKYIYIYIYIHMLFTNKVEQNILNFLFDSLSVLI